MQMYNGVNSDVQRGFDQQSVMAGLGAIQAGQADAALAAANQTTTLLGTLATMQNQNCSDRFNTITTLDNGHNAIMQQMASYEMARQQCCCDNKAAIADLKYTIATEACADRNVVSNGVRDIIQNQNSNTQAILDKLCQQEIEAKNDTIAQLRSQLNNSNMVNSIAQVTADNARQTAQLIGDNAAQTQNLLSQLRTPSPVPAYVVPNPNGCNCGCNYNTCCG
jgi:alanyl-tRNA synthetase